MNQRPQEHRTDQPNGETPTTDPTAARLNELTKAVTKQHTAFSLAACVNEPSCESFEDSFEYRKVTVAAKRAEREGTLGEQPIFDPANGFEGNPHFHKKAMLLGQGVGGHTPDVVMQALDTVHHLIQADPNGKYLQYTQSPGIQELRELYAQRMIDRGVSGLTIDNFAIGAGASNTIAVTLGTLLNPGDKVAVFTPHYPNHRALITENRCEMVEIPMMPDFESGTWKYSEDALNAAIEQDTKVIIICNPNNPTGLVYNKAMLEDLSQKLQGTGIICLVDQPYDAMYQEGHSHIEVPTIDGMRDRTIVCGSASKEFCYTGSRVGYVYAADTDFMDILRTKFSNQNVCAPSRTQYEVAEIIRLANDDPSYYEQMREDLRVSGKTLAENLEATGMFRVIQPQGAYYLCAFPNRDNGWMCQDATQLAWDLVNHTGVATVPSSDMCPPDSPASGQIGPFLRFSFPFDPDYIQEGVNRIEWAIRNTDTKDNFFQTS